MVSTGSRVRIPLRACLSHGTSFLDSRRVALLLQVRSGPMTGAIHAVPGSATVGRSTSSDIVLPDEAVSRSHAAFRVDGQTLVVEDLGSSNGTLVNGELIDIPCRLAPGDVVTVGSTELEVQVGEEPQLSTPTTPTVIQRRGETTQQ
jgi:pSer/pThr/pTyr-binding forkhead associated (FHA) protein